MLSAGLGLPLGGELGGQVELFLPQGQMSKAEGKFDLSVQNFTAGDGKAKIRNTIALPRLNAGNLVLQAEATDGRLEIQRFGANGKDFELDAEGRLRLREPFDKSSVSVDASFKFKEAYTTKSDLTKSLFGSPDSKVPALFDMDPMVRKAKQPDGSYSWHVSGLLAKPNFGPSKKRPAAKEEK
jgi:type II secretion system protein N